MKILFICIGCFLSVVVFAQPKPAKVGVTYGEAINAKGALEVALIEEKLATAESYTGKIKGTVTSVCEKKGCWMKLAQTDGEGIMIRFKDYKFFIIPNEYRKINIINGHF